MLNKRGVFDGSSSLNCRSLGGTAVSSATPPERRLAGYILLPLRAEPRIGIPRPGPVISWLQSQALIKSNGLVYGPRRRQYAHQRHSVSNLSDGVTLDWFSERGPLAVPPVSRRLAAAMIQNATLQPIGKILRRAVLEPTELHGN